MPISRDGFESPKDIFTYKIWNWLFSPFLIIHGPVNEFQIFECKRMKFAEIPGKLHGLLMPPDPIVINHVIT